MAFEPAPLVAGIAAFVPGLAAILVLYSPFDGYFKDNVVFLWFVGGLVVGTPAALLDAYVLAFLPLAYVLGAPLVEQGAKLVFLNRRKWQGDRQAVWNGGAMGAGLGTMVALVAAIQTFAGEFTIAKGLVVAALATGVGFVHVSAGLALGAGVVQRRPFGAYATAAALGVPLALLLALNQYTRILVGFEAGPAIASALALLYGLVALGLARRFWIPEGVGADELRKIRRATRRAD